MLKNSVLTALCFCTAILLQSVWPAAAQAGQKPLWEAGLGIGAISFPDYPGSDQQRSYILPVPYFIYRGKILRADRGGVQAKLFKTNRVNSYFSLSASPPVRSADTPARSGMPDLKPTVEFGPALEVHLWQSAAQRMRLDFRVPLRTVFSIAWHSRQVGWLLAPVLNFDVADVAGQPGWHLGAQTGVWFASRSYNQAYYGVAPVYATANRAAYNAPGGYAGSQFTVALSKRFPGYWVGAFARYDNFNGTVFADSPLLRQRQTLSVGIGIAWILGHSSRTAESHE